MEPTWYLSYHIDNANGQRAGMLPFQSVAFFAILDYGSKSRTCLVIQIKQMFQEYEQQVF